MSGTEATPKPAVPEWVTETPRDNSASPITRISFVPKSAASSRAFWCWKSQAMFHPDVAMKVCGPTSIMLIGFYPSR